MKKLWKKVKRLCRKFVEKLQDSCIWVVRTIKALINWCTKNQEVVYVIVGAVSIGSSIYKKYFYKTAAERELEYQRKHIYDYSLGHHWTLRRELTANEMMEMEERKRNGESMGDILQRMRVLA